MGYFYKNRKIWIIGASSGIGRALAVELAARGACLVLSARDENRLRALRRELAGANTILPLDVTDALAVSAAAAHITADSVIYMAGAYEPMPLDELVAGPMRAIIETNLTGALNVIQAVLPGMLERGQGQIALCASVAGYRGLPYSQPYGATKAAVINLAESLRAEMSGRGLDIKLINPGFVRTPMTAKNKFSMPMIIEPEIAAKFIADGLLSRRFEIHFPKLFTFFLKILRLLPAPLYFAVMKFVKKPLNDQTQSKAHNGGAA